MKGRRFADIKPHSDVPLDTLQFLLLTVLVGLVFSWGVGDVSYCPCVGSFSGVRALICVVRKKLQA